MKIHKILAIACILFLASGNLAAAQSAPQSAAGPTIFKITGTLLTATGEPRTGTVTLVASLYQGQTDTAPLWVEYQQATLDSNGRYTLNVGITFDGGVPKEYFLYGYGRWLGIALLNEPEQPRTMLVAVPYAVKALDADTLAGKPASAFVETANLSSLMKSTFGGTTTSIDAGTNATTNNYVLKTSGGVASDSIIYDNGSNIGINTASPTDKLHIAASSNQNARLMLESTVTNGYGGIVVYKSKTTAGATNTWTTGTGVTDGANSWALYNDYLNSSVFHATLGGNIGIGTTFPLAKLHVAGSANVAGGQAAIRLEDTAGAGGSRTWGIQNAAGNSPYGALGFHVSATAGGTPSAAPVMLINSAGNVGIGTTAPTARLDVAGDINVSGNINAKYQDVAEWVETPTPLEAGTVVIIDPSSANRVLQSVKANDPRVAGAVSKQPGLILGEASDSKEMVAQSGRVRVKVDAKYGAIRVGDLLVTSPTPGYAMRARPVKVGGQLIYRTGTILGKALEALPRGKGEVLVLLTLQ